MQVRIWTLSIKYKRILALPNAPHSKVKHDSPWWLPLNKITAHFPIVLQPIMHITPPKNTTISLHTQLTPDLLYP